MTGRVMVAGAALWLAMAGTAAAGGFYHGGCYDCGGYVYEEWPIAAWRGGGANVHYSGGVVFASDYWPVKRAYYKRRVVSKSAPPKVIYAPR